MVFSKQKAFIDTCKVFLDMYKVFLLYKWFLHAW